MSAIHANAQDVILMKDGNTIVSKILEITASDIKYKKFSNLEGPTYTISKADVKVINYANGEKDSFEETTTTPTETTLPPTSKREASINQLQTLSYEQLSSMTNASFGDLYRQKAKRLKLAGWIGGGALVATGVILALAMIGDDFYEVLCYASIPLVGAGAVWTTAFLLRANHIKKKAYSALNTTPIMHYDFHMKNGKSLMTGVDLLQDSRMPNSRTIGLGLRYNF